MLGPNTKRLAQQRDCPVPFLRRMNVTSPVASGSRRSVTTLLND
jgi:hypothetical protein